MKTNELLRRYVDERSEPAFEELVQQHIDLVYSSALRQVNGDVPAAQDVTQAVFTELARHAPRLTQHTSLAGWLYTSTRFLAAKSRRTEQRRHSHEQEAHEMNQLLHSNDSDASWQELRPMLDDAMHDLSPADREAVLLRYFERMPLVEIGARLGLKETAARMRVDRAMDRLRAALAKRGVTSTVTALTALLTGRAVGSAPSGLALQVSRAAFANAAVTGGLTWGLLKLAGLMKGSALLAAGAAVLVAGIIVVPKLVLTQAGPTGAANAVPAREKSAASGPSTAATDSARINADGTTANEMTLHIVADDTGKPIAGAKIDGFASQNPSTRGGGETLGRQTPFTMTASDQGECQIPVYRGGVLMINSRNDGFVDMRFQWGPRRGNGIPQEYTVRLIRATPVGGQVVNEQGQPVGGAQIIVDCRVGAGSGRGSNLASPGISPMAWERTISDADGFWHVDRFAKENVKNLVVLATHADYATNDELSRAYVSLGSLHEAEQQLLAGTYIYRLDHGTTVQGIVLDLEGNPVAGADVVIRSDTRSREMTNQPDGTFMLTACKVGVSKISAQAHGFTPLTLNMALTNNQTPLLLRLNRAKPLRLRLVNINGSPVTNALVLEQNEYGVFNTNSDADGLITWDSPPEGDLYFGFRAEGYASQENVRLKADGAEQRITLYQARTISGSVSDLATSLPVPNFRVATGATGLPGSIEGTNVSWQRSQGFQDGRFNFMDDSSGAGSMYKFEADGYAPFVTRLVGPEEGEVSFDVVLKPAAATTIRVVLPDGLPATNASIGLQIPGTLLRLMPGGFRATFEALGRGAYTNVFPTDQAGRFDLPQDDAIVRVIAACPAGYVEAAPASLAGNATMRLQPWGRLEGTLSSGGKPAAGRTLSLAPGPGWETGGISYSFEAGTDANGHFAFTNVPPRHFYLFLQELPAPLKNMIGGSSASSQAVMVRSGETTTVSLELYPVTARLNWPAGIDRQADWRVNGTIELVPLAGELPSEFPMNETEGGTWGAEGLPVGNYTVHFKVFRPTADDPEGKLLWWAEAPFMIPADPPGGMVDAGGVTLQPAQ